MSRINVVVAAASRDVKAEVIAECVAARSEMHLVNGHYVLASQVGAILQSISVSDPCALVLVGRPEETDELGEQWLGRRSELVVMHVDIVDDFVRIGLRDPHMDALLAALRELVERVGTSKRERIARIQLRSPSVSESTGGLPEQASPERPLLRAGIDWVHKILRDAVGRVSEDNGDLHGLSVTRKTILQSLDSLPECGSNSQRPEIADADDALTRALVNAEATAEPLAATFRMLELSHLEFRLLLLAMAPELDLRFQRCIGFLLDEMGRRVGTMALYTGLLGETASVRQRLADSGALWRWRVFEQYGGHQPGADEPLKVDPFLVQWLLGEETALTSDPRIRRVVRTEPWIGFSLLQRVEERAAATELLSRVQNRETNRWILLCGDDPAAWRALLELGADLSEVDPIRVEPARLAGLDLNDVEECAMRIARENQLTGGPLVIDLATSEGTEAEDEVTRFFLATVSRHCHAAVICRDEARAVRLLGPVLQELPVELALPASGRVDAMREAAKGADAFLTETAAESAASRYPLAVDRMEQAMRMAANRSLNWAAHDPRLDRFLAACREVAAEGISHLAERLDPVFTLEDVVLPRDRKQQLLEIVDHVRLAPRVLDDWNFGVQMPYGRGVTALFFGPSGTGKTMAAMAIARQLGIQVLRLDLSKIVSKYIGDTEKNLDRVFNDAQRSGSAILIDEAEALLGKRSEVKDAHDRYANIEVAYLLQRMEAYEGLAILTTNLRQNLDGAFLRRLRFIVDFPMPEVDARRQIWHQCLPEDSHVLDELAFRQLARKVVVPGGNIRQITLRAAFIAAAAETRINMEHIGQAVNAEFAKLGMPPIEIGQAETRMLT